MVYVTVGIKQSPRARISARNFKFKYSAPGKDPYLEPAGKDYDRNFEIRHTVVVSTVDIANGLFHYRP